MDFLHECAKFANEIKEPVGELLITGNIDASKSVTLLLAFFVAFILLFFTKFPSFILSVLKLFVCFFNLILKVFEIQLKLMTYLFEKISLFFDFLAESLISSLNFLLISCPGYCFSFIKDKLKKKIRFEIRMPAESKNISINNIVLNQKVENNQSQVLNEKHVIYDLNQKYFNLQKLSNHFAPNSNSFSKNIIDGSNEADIFLNLNYANNNQIINELNKTMSFDHILNQTHSNISIDEPIESNVIQPSHFDTVEECQSEESDEQPISSNQISIKKSKYFLALIIILDAFKLFYIRSCKDKIL